MRRATAAEIARWDDLVVANPDGGHILQSRAWGEVKRRYGWQPEYCISNAAGSDVALLFLRKRLAPFGELWYASKGPGVADVGQLAAVVEELRRQKPAFTVKLEPELPASHAAAAAIRRMGLRRARHDVQNTQATIVVDIRKDDDALLASFKPKTRYNIRLAQRHGVAVDRVPANDANLHVMYALMRSTEDRSRRFTLRPYRYFRDYWQLHEAAGRGQLFFAVLDGEVLAGVFATFLGRKGWYKDGGSTKARPEVMAPHLLHWEVMRFLRANGIERYDLGAVPPRDSADEAHPLHGLQRFKAGFHSETTEYVGTLDLVLDRARNAIWEGIIERAAHQWAYRVRHDLFY